MILILKLITVCIAIFPIFACGKTTHISEKPIIVHESTIVRNFYSQGVDCLNKNLDQYFEKAQNIFPVFNFFGDSKVLIVPHAGYYYSGLCAATAYQTLLTKNNLTPLLMRKNKKISKVIILAPCHTMMLHGVALPKSTVYRTPLGDISVDTQTIKKLSKHDLFNINDAPFINEHAIDVQLPFLQKTVAYCTIVPIIVGYLKDDEPLKIAKIIEKIIDENTLVIVSSDFVHHGKVYEYNVFDKNIIDSIARIDSRIVEALNHYSLNDFYTCIDETGATICGREPLKILLSLFERNSFGSIQASTNCYYTSAHKLYAEKQNQILDDVTVFDNVPDVEAAMSVSYVAMTFGSANKASNVFMNTLTGYEQKSLLSVARKSIYDVLKNNEIEKVEHFISIPIVSVGLEHQHGVFVTLTQNNGEIRGCMGQIVGFEPLYKTVMKMSQSAAFSDSRFKPVSIDEFKNIRIHITVISEPKMIDSYENIILGKHGIILQVHDSNTGSIIASSVFLPKIPINQGWDVQTTLEKLSVKAGLDKNAWKGRATLFVFEGFEISE